MSKGIGAATGLHVGCRRFACKKCRHLALGTSRDRFGLELHIRQIDYTNTTANNQTHVACMFPTFEQRHKTHMLAVYLLKNRVRWRAIVFAGPILQQRPKLSHSFGIRWPSEQAGVDTDLNGRVSKLVEN